MALYHTDLSKRYLSVADHDYQNGVQVKFLRFGISRWFDTNSFMGGLEEALYWAKDFRDEVEAMLGLDVEDYKKFGCGEEADKPLEIEHITHSERNGYVAMWNVDGLQQNAYFSIIEYGDEKAFEMACKYRNFMIKVTTGHLTKGEAMTKFCRKFPLIRDQDINQEDADQEGFDMFFSVKVQKGCKFFLQIGQTCLKDRGFKTIEEADEWIQKTSVELSGMITTAPYVFKFSRYRMPVKIVDKNGNSPRKNYSRSVVPKKPIKNVTYTKTGVLFQLQKNKRKYRKLFNTSEYGTLDNAMRSAVLYRENIMKKLFG